MTTEEARNFEITEDMITELENAYEEVFGDTIEIGDDIEDLNDAIGVFRKNRGLESAQLRIVNIAKISRCGRLNFVRLFCLAYGMLSGAAGLPLYLRRYCGANTFGVIEHYLRTRKSNSIPSLSMDSCITFLKTVQKENEKLKAANAKLMQENADLKAGMKDMKDDLAEANRQMKNIKTEDDFVKRMVELAKENSVGSPDDAKPYAQMLKELSRSKEAAELRQWMKEEKKAMQQVNIEKVNDIHDNDSVTAKLM